LGVWGLAFSSIAELVERSSLTEHPPGVSWSGREGWVIAPWAARDVSRCAGGGDVHADDICQDRGGDLTREVQKRRAASLVVVHAERGSRRPASLNPVPSDRHDIDQPGEVTEVRVDGEVVRESRGGDHQVERAAATGLGGESTESQGARCTRDATLRRRIVQGSVSGGLRSIGPQGPVRCWLGHAWPSRATIAGVRVNVGQAKTDLSRLLARVEAGEDVEIARDGVPVARLVRIEPMLGPGARFLGARGSLAGQITIGDDFEFTDEELDELLDEPA